jgi:acid phosphatase type 7
MTFDVTEGQKAYYQVTANGEQSAVFEVTPVVGPTEKFAVFGDFGFANDICMNDLIQEAAAGTYNSVLHVGDWAYNFEQDTGCGAVSCVGNNFMNLMQGYASIAPVMPAAGNHEACGGCPASPINPDTKGNFSEYRSRLHSVSLFAGANAGSNNNIYYSFNQGITHFIVFSAEAYIYAVDKTFLSNQLAFMTKDLAAVDRKVTPWVVALVHKDWTMEADAFKDFAPILDKGGVDILFCGHVSFILLLCLVSVFNLHISNTSCLVI